MTTWITKKDNKVERICQTGTGVSPGPEWSKVPNDWNGNQEDSLDWYDADMRRIPDSELVGQGKRKDNRGIWFNKKSRETKIISALDKEPGEGWTREAPIENEPYQKWSEDSGSWIADTEKKEEAEKNQRIAETRAAIEDAERRIQRSTRAKLAGTATAEDEKYFRQIAGEIDSLREELGEITSVQWPEEK
jgi:hypothetical protein